MLPVSMLEPGVTTIVYLRGAVVRGRLTSVEDGTMFFADADIVRVPDGVPVFVKGAEFPLSEAIACGKSFDKSALAKEKLCWDMNKLY